MAEKLKWATWLLIGLACIMGLIGLTAVDKMPSEVLAALAATIITAIFEEKRYTNLDESWHRWYKEQNNGKGNVAS